MKLKISSLLGDANVLFKITVLALKEIKLE